MRMLSIERLLAPCRMLTGLAVVLAASSPALAGWNCQLDARGEWNCSAGGIEGTDSAGADVVSAPAATAPETSATPGSGEPATAAAVTTDVVAAEPVSAAEPAGGDAATLASPAHVTRLSDDWVPAERLTDAQRKAMSPEGALETTLCCGAYVDPSANALAGQSPDTPLNAHADDSDTDLATQTSTLSGNVQISQGQRYLRADKATLQKNPQRVALEGNVTLREPGLLLVGNQADVLVDEKTAELSDVQYLLHEQHIHGSAASLSRSETGVISMVDARYSYCPVDDQQWALDAGSLTIDPNDSQGRARDVTLRVGDVPVFYTPYLQFPLGKERMSGFLVPSFGSGEDGFDIETPYYLNLASNYDLLLTPRYIDERGLALGTKFRHMSEATQNQLITNYLPSDDKVDAGEDSDRWYYRGTHSGAAERWQSQVDMASVSDDDYFHDLGGSSFRIGNTTQLRRMAQAEYLPDNWRVGALAKNYQTLGDTTAEPHEVLPSLFADGTYALESGPVVKLHHAASSFDHKDEGDLQAINGIFYDIDFNPLTQGLGAERQLISGRRYNLDYSVELPLRTAGAFLTPKVGVRHVNQQLDDTTVNTPDSNPSATVEVASLDSGLIFERDSQWFDKPYRQTLEPRLFYYYAGQQDQDDFYNFESDSLSFSYAQLFRDYRLAGEDYLDDANQVSLGVSSRLLSPSSGRELLRAGIGQTYYLDKREIVLERDAATAAYERDRSHSSLVADVAAHLNRYWDIRSELLWNDDKASRERQSLSLRYRDEERRIFNTGYQYLDRVASPDMTGVVVDRAVEQYYVSGVLPVDNQWSLIAHWNYDVTNSRDLETIAGVEYDSCCWSARLVARHWVINDDFIDNVDEQETRDGLFLQVQFKSLGNFGDSLESMLSDSIWGFEDRNKPLD